MTAPYPSPPATGAVVSALGSPIVVDVIPFAALVWGTVALVVAVFAYLLYGVVRAGGIALTGEGH